MKEAISECFKEKSQSPFAKYIESFNATRLNELFPIICMAIYRNITVKYKTVPNLPVDLFKPLLTKHFNNQFLDNWKELIDNSFKNHMRIDNVNWPNIDLNQLMIQAKFSILYSKSNLVKSLARLMQAPNEFQQSYLPTMAQDEMFDIHKAVRAYKFNQITLYLN